MSNKLNILIDSNSLSHLSEIEIGRGRSAQKWLWEYFNVFTCKAVKEEFSKGINKRSDKAKAMARALKKKGVILKNKNIDLIEEKIITHFYKKPLGEDDKGERHLLVTAIDNVCSNKFPFCIILTDDYTAIEKFMESIKENFIFGDIWTVFDVILYLFLCKKEVSYSQAEMAVRDLTALSSISIKKKCIRF